MTITTDPPNAAPPTLDATATDDDPLDVTQRAVFDAEDFLTRLEGALACIHSLTDMGFSEREHAYGPESGGLIFAIGAAMGAAKGLRETLYPGGGLPWAQEADGTPTRRKTTGRARQC